MFTQAALLALAALTPLVSAHGSMHSMTINGQEYVGPIPASQDGQQYTIREINTVDPIKGANNTALSCGQGAGPAALTAPANAGDTVAFKWHNGEEGPWVHNIGAVMTYMAPCDNNDCTTFDSTQANWFKIDEKGRHPEGNWFVSDYNNNSDATLDATIPNNLPAGQYLIRHEILALHNGESLGGAEFYAGCGQLQLTASNNATAKLPGQADTVTLPGAYSDTDPGILVPGVYDPGFNYTFPGPAVVNDAEIGTSIDNGNGDSLDNGVVDSDDGSSTNPSGSDAGSGTPTSSDTSAPTQTAGSGCGGGNGSRKMKRVVKRIIRQEVRKVASKARRQASKPAQVQQAVKRDVHHPVRTNSRVMRGLNLN